MWVGIVLWTMFAVAAAVTVLTRKRGTRGRPRDIWVPMTEAERRLADRLLETAYAVPCPDGIAHFEESVVAMLQQRKAAGS